MADFCELFIKHSAFSTSSPWQPFCFLFVHVRVTSGESRRSLGSRETQVWLTERCPVFSGALHSVGLEREKSGAIPSFQFCRRRLWTEEGWTEQGAWGSALSQYCLPSTRHTKGETTA